MNSSRNQCRPVGNELRSEVEFNQVTSSTCVVLRSPAGLGPAAAAAARRAGQPRRRRPAAHGGPRAPAHRGQAAGNSSVSLLTTMLAYVSLYRLLNPPTGT